MTTTTTRYTQEADAPMLRHVTRHATTKVTVVHTRDEDQPTAVELMARARSMAQVTGSRQATHSEVAADGSELEAVWTR